MKYLVFNSKKEASQEAYNIRTCDWINSNRFIRRDDR